MQAAPIQAELLYRSYKVIEEKMTSRMKEDKIMEKCGKVATDEELPREPLLG